MENKSILIYFVKKYIEYFSNKHRTTNTHFTTIMYHISHQFNKNSEDSAKILS